LSENGGKEATRSRGGALAHLESGPGRQETIKGGRRASAVERGGEKKKRE